MNTPRILSLLGRLRATVVERLRSFISGACRHPRVAIEATSYRPVGFGIGADVGIGVTCIDCGARWAANVRAGDVGGWADRLGWRARSKPS